MLSKTDYVRTLPAELDVHEVVRRARAAGIKLSIATVYAARRDGAREIRTHRAVESLAATPGERQLLELTMEMGFARAATLIAALRQRLVEESDS